MSVEELVALGYSPAALAAGGCSPAQCMASGIPLAALLPPVFPLERLLFLGNKALIEARVPLKDLVLACGAACTLPDIKFFLAAGASLSDLALTCNVTCGSAFAAGCDLPLLKSIYHDLTAAGLSVRDAYEGLCARGHASAVGALLEVYPRSSLLAFPPSALLSGGFSLMELSHARHIEGLFKCAEESGGSPERHAQVDELLGWGVPVACIYASGLRLEGRKWRGTKLQEHKDAGATCEEAYKAGYSAPALLAAGYAEAEAQRWLLAELFRAIHEGDVVRVAAAIERGASVTAKARAGPEFHNVPGLRFRQWGSTYDWNLTCVKPWACRLSNAHAHAQPRWLFLLGLLFITSSPPFIFSGPCTTLPWVGTRRFAASCLQAAPARCVILAAPAAMSTTQLTLSKMTRIRIWLRCLVEGSWHHALREVAPGVTRATLGHSRR